MYFKNLFIFLHVYIRCFRIHEQAAESSKVLNFKLASFEFFVFFPWVLSPLWLAQFIFYLSSLLARLLKKLCVGGWYPELGPTSWTFGVVSDRDLEAGILKEKCNIFLSILSSFEMKYLLLTQIWFWIEGVERLSSLGGGMWSVVVCWTAAETNGKAENMSVWLSEDTVLQWII